jgi:two-component system, chemotaxis family, chemotaxis protein CheY
MENPMKVLVVDDDVVSRMVLMHMIDSLGDYEILEAEDGADAWEQLEHGLRPSIVFCDLRMPRLSGMELLERIKTSPALGGVPFVLVSSATERATVEQASGLGAAGYVIKPFEAGQVREHMAALGGKADAAGAAEAPQATMARLGINGERLMVYLGGLQAQLTGAGAEIGALIAGGRDAEARQRIDRLHAGCVTLGLSGAAAALKALAPDPLDPARVQALLTDAVRAAMHQSEAVKRQLAPA